MKALIIAAGILSLTGTASTSRASSEAGLDIPFQPVRVRVLYSVALDYGGAEDCIQDPQCLLFDILALLQAHSSHLSQKEVLQFDLYQSSKKAGNHLSLDRDPFEGGHYKTLYDGRANRELGRQVMTLLRRHLKLLPNRVEQPESIKLFKCSGNLACEDIMIGAFPSEEMHTGYCAAPGRGCDSESISVAREEMNNYFSAIAD